MPIKLLQIIGARPQFIKYSAIQQAMDRAQHKTTEFSSVLVHTGQHYDYQMSQVFFDELGIRPPDYHLEAGSGNHGKQTALVLQKCEDVLLKEKPDIVVVYGDTNSTLGGALAAAKLHIPVAHIEAGLRSFNKKMPEEINRVLTDHMSTYLFCPSQVAVDNLAAEGIPSNASHLTPAPSLFKPYVSIVGDVMYDVLLYALAIANKKSKILEHLNIKTKQYNLLTLHRAENTDNVEQLEDLIDFVNDSVLKIPVIFPMHPRMVKAYAGARKHFKDNVRIIEPLGYFDLLMVLKNANCLLTDSGGMQKEAYWLHVSCITLREQTEWIETVQSGWNILWRDYRGLHQTSDKTDAYGEGHAAEKIIEELGVKSKVLGVKSEESAP